MSNKSAQAVRKSVYSDQWYVASASGGDDHKVSLTIKNHKYVCDCMSFRYRRQCSHIETAKAGRGERINLTPVQTAKAGKRPRIVRGERKGTFKSRSSRSS